MRVLGITDGQTSGAAVTEGYRTLAAVNEERICRLKLARGFPWKSIEEVLRLSSTDPSDIVAVGVAQEDMTFREEVDGWPGWFEARSDDADVHAGFFKLASRFGRLAPYVPGLKNAYYLLRTPFFRKRRRRIRELLRERYGIEAPVFFHHHHYAHATSAYFTSGYKDALVVTMDGGGDRHSSHVYSVKDGVFERLNTIDSYDSLGNYYAYVTALCGFKAKRHEGKVTGLAARGSPAYREIFDRLIAYENGRTVNRGHVLFQSALKQISRELPDDWSMTDIAATIQAVAEDVARSYVQYWARSTGLSNVALAGGLFANVRINEEIHRLPEVDSAFVHPGMSDEGLGVGAALATWHDLARERGVRYEPATLPDVYLGTEYAESEIADALKRAGVESVHHPGKVEDEIADLLSQGKVVARFNGRMEYGPRALGNRSILYQPGDPTVNDWLNELLRRTEFMPFAPASLYDAADDLYVCSEGARDTARFMTITFHCTPWMEERCQGVVHVDSTARPQMVRKEDNESFWKIIKGYQERTGVPVIINTSFNIHEEPIVRSPDDALRAFLDSHLDYLAIGDFLCKGPVGSADTRKKWENKSRWGYAVKSPTSM